MSSKQITFSKKKSIFTLKLHTFTLHKYLYCPINNALMTLKADLCSVRLSHDESDVKRSVAEGVT